MENWFGMREVARISGPVPPNVATEIRVPRALRTELNLELKAVYVQVSYLINPSLEAVRDVFKENKAKNVEDIEEIQGMKTTIEECSRIAEALILEAQVGGEPVFYIPQRHLDALTYLGVSWPARIEAQMEATKADRAGEATKAARAGEEATKAAPAGKESTKAAPAGKESTKAAPVGKESTKAAPVGKDATKAAPAGKDATKAAPAGKDATKAAPAGKESTKAPPAGKEATKAAPAAGKEATKAAPAGKEATKATPAGKDARAAPAGKDARAAPAGKDARASPAGKDARASQAGKAKAVEVMQEAGKAEGGYRVMMAATAITTAFIFIFIVLWIFMQ